MAAGSRFSLDACGRAWSNALLALLTCLLLSACAGGQTQPFAKSGKPSGRTPPAIVVRSMEGIPSAKENVLFSSLVSAAGPRDIAIVKGEFQGSYSLMGSFRATQSVEGASVDYRWVLLNDKNQQIHTITGSEAGRPVDGDPWDGIDPDTLRRVAAYTAENLSSRLAQLGFATLSAGLMPPADTFVEAGPGAEKDIDPVLYGRLAAAVMAPQPAAAPIDYADAGALADDPGPEFSYEPPELEEFDPGSPTEQAEAPEPQPPGDPESRKSDLGPPPARAPTPAPAPQRVAAKPEQLKISAVAVTAVKGSPGKGNGELVSAMRKVLRDAGWPVLTKGQYNALSIDGTVKLGRAEGGTQAVELHWTVRMPDGEVLGTVKQANRVEAGSLEQGWGEAAGFAAQGAAEGIFDIVGKLQKRL